MSGHSVRRMSMLSRSPLNDDRSAGFRSLRQRTLLHCDSRRGPGRVYGHPHHFVVGWRRAPRYDAVWHRSVVGAAGLPCWSGLGRVRGPGGRETLTIRISGDVLGIHEVRG